LYPEKKKTTQKVTTSVQEGKRKRKKKHIKKATGPAEKESGEKRDPHSRKLKGKTVTTEKKSTRRGWNLLQKVKKKI